MVFAGAGVSMGEPARLPSFRGLTEQIASGTGRQIREDEPLDRFLGELHHNGGNVRKRAADILGRGDLAPTALHNDLLKIAGKGDQLRIVTTNFDLLFERALGDRTPPGPEIYRAPALPLGNNFTGIVHIHGAITRPEDMVLTDADFGRAYLTEGWARRFLVSLFNEYDVLFVGYSHEDVIMHYLARGIPSARDKLQIILTGDRSQPRNWDALGIQAVIYPQDSPDDHTALDQSIHQLATLVTRGILDWRREIAEIADGSPPFDEEQSGMVKYALQDAANTRFFTESARRPEWLDWLGQRGLLDALFTEGSLGEKDQVLGRWLARNYASECADVLQLMISIRGMCVNPEFWHELACWVAEDTNLTAADFNRWICVLLATAPARQEGYPLRKLGNRCAEFGDLKSLLCIFETMLSQRLTLHRLPSSLPLSSNTPRRNMDVVIENRVNAWLSKDLYENTIKPRLPETALELFPIILKKLEERHYTLNAWGLSRHDSWKRSAIEPHEQDSHVEEALALLVDIARDCLEWMAENASQDCAHYCGCLAASEAPLLQRLGVHVLTQRMDLSPDGKLEWLLSNVGLHNHEAHHEIFISVRELYPQASAGMRAAIRRAVLDYHVHDIEDAERHTEYRHFTWFHWLLEAYPDCEATRRELRRIQSRHPEFCPREHPDLTHWIGSAEFRGPVSPWSVEALLAETPASWLPRLLEFQPTEFLGPDREGLRHTVSLAASRQFSWGLGLARALANGEHWASDLWSALIRSWTDAELDSGEMEDTLGIIEVPPLQMSQARAVADFLKSRVRQRSGEVNTDTLNRLNRLAESLWNHLDRSEAIRQNNDWLTTAINDPAGILAQFWLQSISLERRLNADGWNGLTEIYEVALSRIVQDTSRAGILGRCVLMLHVDYLLFLDRDRTSNHLLPLLSTGTPEIEYQAAWDGFLASGNLSPELAEKLEEAFHDGITHLDDILAPHRERFIEYYSAQIAFHANNPVRDWIPDLFEYGERTDRRSFAAFIERYLFNLHVDGQREWWNRWMREYWENRIQGVPRPLESEEIEAMLGWVPHLSAVFPEAIALACQMPRAPISHASFIHDLELKPELVNQYPQDVLRLLQYLASVNPPGYVIYGLSRLVGMLRESSMNSQPLVELEEFCARFNLHDSTE